LPAALCASRLRVAKAARPLRATIVGGAGSAGRGAAWYRRSPAKARRLKSASCAVTDHKIDRNSGSGRGPCCDAERKGAMLRTAEGGAPVMARSKSGGESGTIVIKKYANRRLYDTETSSYITLELLSQMTREGRDFVVVDAKSGEDITHNVLTQIIMEEEQRGENMLPVNFLRQLISLYGDSMQSMVPQYLEASMEAFRKNQQQFQEAMQGAFAGGPFAEIAKRNMEMLNAAANAFKPAAPGAAKAGESAGDEVAELKAQLAALNAKIDKLGG
jgi:polyhydroxyalkanoate synthesis repressor PhaR